MDKLDFQKMLAFAILVVGLLAAGWSASMLVGGLIVSGQLSSEANPLGDTVLYIAAGSIIGATSLWYYGILNKEPGKWRAVILSGLLVVMLALFASVTQLFSVVDASSGAAFEKGAQASVTSVWSATQAIDQNIAEVYGNRITFSADRMQEELETGRGPRFRAAEANYNRLRQVYGSVLATPLSRVPQNRSLSDNISGARDYITALRGKVQVFENFGRDVQIVTPDYNAQLDSLVARLDRLSGGGDGADGTNWVDRKTLVYTELVFKLEEMIASRGQADLGFTLSFLMAVMPDIIQVIYALLLIMMRTDSYDPVRDTPHPRTRVRPSKASAIKRFFQR